MTKRTPLIQKQKKKTDNLSSSL